MGKLSVYSDGTPEGTVILTEDGEKIEGVMRVDITMEPTDVVRVSLELRPAVVQVSGAKLDRAITSCPACSEDVEHECEDRQVLGTLADQIKAQLKNSTVTVYDPNNPATSGITGHNLRLTRIKDEK